MTLAELQTLIGGLTNDPNHDRYTIADINIELDNTQDHFNVEAKLLKDTVSVSLVAGTRQYSIGTFGGTVIAFDRVTHKGLRLEKVDKAFMDLYSGYDWTQDQGTPVRYLIETFDPSTGYLTLHPSPDDNAAAYPVIVEYIKRHDPMSASTDVPFMSGGSSNPVLRPYDQYIAYDVAGRLLKRDPSPINLARSVSYESFVIVGFSNLIQVAKALEKEVPFRLKSIYRPVGQAANGWGQW